MLLKVIQKLSSECQIETDSIELIEEEDDCPVDSQNVMDSTKKTMKGKDELQATFENEMDSMDQLQK
jgi:hypothetical protein